VQEKIEKNPEVREDTIVSRDMMKIIHTHDHRFGDAEVLVRFLNIIRDILEDICPQLSFYGNRKVYDKKTFYKV
jgi:pyruvate/2-oxoglutarate dehydrogenase complex dihydrolipoamide acyltransferase (E2) component